MERIVVDSLPPALGPYCHGTSDGNMVFTSGQIPLYKESGTVEEDVRKATRMILENLLLIVEAGGGSLETVARVDIILTDLADYEVLNDEYAKFFGEAKPARIISTSQALPGGAKLEMAMTAFVD